MEILREISKAMYFEALLREVKAKEIENLKLTGISDLPIISLAYFDNNLDTIFRSGFYLGIKEVGRLTESP